MLRPQSYVCRHGHTKTYPTDVLCNPHEYCDGIHPECPEDDIVLPDYELCHNKGPGYCYKGLCRTHNSGCQLLWGDKAVSGANVCYDLNHQGSQVNDMGSSVLWY